MSGRLSGEVALVTGGTGFLGRAIVARLHEEGAYVGVGSRELSRAKKVVEELALENAHAISLDVCDDYQRSSALEQMSACAGSNVNILVANASNREVIGRSWNQVKDSDFTDLFRTDVIGHFRLAEAMLSLGGKSDNRNIVWLSSIYAQAGVDASIYPVGMNGAPPQYCCTKGAVESIVRTLACRWGKDGVRVNAVVSGGIENRERQASEFIENYARRVPLGRLARVDEIAATVSFVASNEASYISGTCLAVDGGYLAW